MFFIAFRLERFGLDRRIIDIIEDRKIESLRWVQVLALRAGVLDGENIFVSAPSASGKTFIGELAALQNIVKNKKKSVFLVPLRALAAEKYYEFAKIYSKLGIKVEIRTGDYEINKETLEKVDLLVSTYERFDSLLRNGLWWLTEVGMIVIDEVHMINDINRGPRLESLLARL
ncbi:MAG: DEAD/DEAH box helicase, partial [Candidatus Hodarchaeota archaeon]